MNNNNEKTQKKKIILKNILNIGLLSLITVIIVLSFFTAVFHQRDINDFENRYAYKFVKPTISSINENVFQTKTEEAFSDQIPKASGMKNLYQNIHSNFLKLCLNPFLKRNPHNYIDFMDISVMAENQLVFRADVFSEYKKDFDKRINNYNEIISKNKDTEFYIYYIEKDTDIDFENNKKTGEKEYLFSNIDIKPQNKASFTINNYSDFRENFYLTDHHWNYKGSYKAYGELVKLLNCKGNLIKPQDEKFIYSGFVGSKSRNYAASLFHEDVSAYEFEFPEYNIKINGQAVEDYGNQEVFLSNKADEFTYSRFYGDDYGEIIFDNSQSSSDTNILIIGESYDNAVLKLIASHFKTTYSIDLRHYERSMSKKFDITEYIKENNIDKVLFIGNRAFYTSDDFVLEK